MRGGTLMRRTTLRVQLNPKAPGSLGALLEGNFNNLYRALEQYERNRFQPASPDVLSDIYMYGKPNMDAFQNVKKWLDDNKSQDKPHMPTMSRDISDVKDVIDDLMVIYKFSMKYGERRRITSDTFLVNEDEFRRMLTNVLTGKIYEKKIFSIYENDENYKKLNSTLNVCGEALLIMRSGYENHIKYDKDSEGIFNKLSSDMLDLYKGVLLDAEVGKYKIQNSTNTVPPDKWSKEIEPVVQQQLDYIKQQLKDKVWEHYPPRSEEQPQSSESIRPANDEGLKSPLLGRRTLEEDV
jgi:hypothetical protein